MLKFRPSNLTQKRANINFNELQLIALIEKGLSDSSLRGFLYKRSSPSAKWRLKWFLLFENLLFYFDLPHNQQPQHRDFPSSPDHQHQHQPQSQPQPQPSPSKSSAFSSLIKRQTKHGRAALAREFELQQRLAQQPGISGPAAPGKTNEEQPPRRASASETESRCRPAAAAAAEDELETRQANSESSGNELSPASSAPAKGASSGRRDRQQLPLTMGASGSGRQRLSSDPQNAPFLASTYNNNDPFRHPQQSSPANNNNNNGSGSR